MHFKKSGQSCPIEGSSARTEGLYCTLTNGLSAALNQFSALLNAQNPQDDPGSNQQREPRAVICETVGRRVGDGYHRELAVFCSAFDDLQRVQRSLDAS
jgi:hypothetical protein